MSDDYTKDLEMIYDVLVEIRDLLKPPDVITPPFDSALFPIDLGPCTVEFCTEKSAYLLFEREDLLKLFVPFSRMPAGVQERCENKDSFKEFFVGDWLYERLKEQTKEDRAKDGRADDLPF